jgi:hypothetical protein
MNKMKKKKMKNRSKIKKKKINKCIKLMNKKIKKKNNKKKIYLNI